MSYNLQNLLMKSKLKTLRTKLQYCLWVNKDIVYNSQSNNFYHSPISLIVSCECTVCRFYVQQEEIGIFNDYKFILTHTIIRFSVSLRNYNFSILYSHILKRR